MNSNILGKVVIPLVFLGMALAMLMIGNQKTIIEEDVCLLKPREVNESNKATIDSAYLNIKLRSYKNHLYNLTQEISLETYLLKDSARIVVDTLIARKSRKFKAEIDSIYALDTTAALKLTPEHKEFYYDSSKIITFVKSKAEKLDSISIKELVAQSSTINKDDSDEADIAIKENKTLNETHQVKETVYTQPVTFIYLAIALACLSIIMLLFSFGYINKYVAFASVPLFLGLSVYLGFTTYQKIDKTNAYAKRKKKVYEASKHRLLDIRDAQEKYHQLHKKYTDDFTELKRFLKNDKITHYYKEGNTPNRVLTEQEAIELGFDIENDQWEENMTEVQAWQLKIIVRDTLQVNPEELLFFSRESKIRRKERGEYNIDSLAFMPYSLDSLLIETRKQRDSDSTYQYFLEVRLSNPMLPSLNSSECEEPEELFIGNLFEPNLNPSWSK